jgi:type IV pilus assembly protein PilP
MKYVLSLAAGAIALSMLAGCSPENEELIQWMQDEHKAVKPNVPPVYPPKKFDPQAYLGAEGVDPFGAQKLVAAAGSSSKQSSSLLAAAQNHRTEPLEAYPLDSMTMVGAMVQGGKAHALLRVENLLHDVKVGDWIGQNYGRVTKITETELTLNETVQDATGEWIERTSTLQLQEKAAEKAR